MERQGVIAALVTCLFWSSSFAGIRAGLEAYTPTQLVFIRFLTASVVFVVYALAVRMPLPKPRDWGYLAFLGICGITIYHTALALGERTVPAGTASLIIAMAPVFTAILSRWFLQEHLSRWGWTGLLLSFAGVVIMTVGGNGEVGYATGIFTILLSAVCSAVYFVFAKPMFLRYAPIHVTAYVTWAGTLPMLLFAPGVTKAIAAAPLASTWPVVYIGIFPAAVAYASWSIALSKMPASRTSTFLYLNPPLAIFLGWLWVQEIPAMLSLVGGLVALAGVVVVNTWGNPPAAQRTSPRAATDQTVST